MEGLQVSGIVNFSLVMADADDAIDTTSSVSVPELTPGENGLNGSLDTLRLSGLRKVGEVAVVVVVVVGGGGGEARDGVVSVT